MQSIGLHPLDVPDLICFWDFQEETGTPRHSKGLKDYPLVEFQGPIERIAGGIWGQYSARIDRGQWLRIPRKDCPALDIHGEGAQFTVLAWIKRASDCHWQFIAGMWDEADAQRQYALFTSGSRKNNWRTFTRTPAAHQAHSYISAEGGGTPGKGVCYSYGTGATVLAKDRWYFLAATYDQRDMRVYVDGKLDVLENYNPFHYPDKPIFDGGADGADFTVAQRAVPAWHGYPDTKIHQAVGFEGVIGGLAVYDRALTPDEIQRIHDRAAAERGPE